MHTYIHRYVCICVYVFICFRFNQEVALLAAAAISTSFFSCDVRCWAFSITSIVWTKRSVRWDSVVERHESAKDLKYNTARFSAVFQHACKQLWGHTQTPTHTKAPADGETVSLSARNACIWSVYTHTRTHTHAHTHTNVVSAIFLNWLSWHGRNIDCCTEPMVWEICSAPPLASITCIHSITTKFCLTQKHVNPSWSRRIYISMRAGKIGWAFAQPMGP